MGEELFRISYGAEGAPDGPSDALRVYSGLGLGQVNAGVGTPFDYVELGGGGEEARADGAARLGRAAGGPDVCYQGAETLL